MSAWGTELQERAEDGERILVECVTCGYGDGGNLTLLDRYVQEGPPIPRGTKQDWLEVWDDERDEGRPSGFCPECGEEYEGNVIERPEE